MTDAQMAVNLVAFSPDQKACTASEVVGEGRRTGFRNRRVPHFETWVICNMYFCYSHFTHEHLTRYGH